MVLRSPICTVVGHVDHGKSSILDRIRRSKIVAGEAGKITQHIGASVVPLDIVKKICGDLLKSIGLTIPGILFIDTPGHAAFTHLRKRGGNLADIAILVVDINEGFKPQTIESIEILRSYKTPFVIAANKVDLLPRWRSDAKTPVLANLQKQTPEVITAFETKMYELVGKMFEFGMESERFDRVGDFTKQIAIVPVSAETGEGIPELLMVISGLAQKFLENNLKCECGSSAKGTILEVKEEKGLGKTVDVIIYDGSLHVNDTIVIGGINQPIVTKIRALLEPLPLKEMRDKKTKFKSVKEAVAATGVKIAAPELDEVVPGMPIRSCAKEDIDKVSEDIQREVDEVIVETEEDGIIVKADTLGSLEAVTALMREYDFKVRKANVGAISKKDVAEAESNHDRDPFTSVIVGFNVDVKPDVKTPDNVKIINSDVIYRLVEDMQKYVEEEKKRQEMKALEGLTWPCKIELMRGYVFRQNNPAVVGCDVLSGKLKTGMQLMKADGQPITSVKSMQKEKESKSDIKVGEQAAVAMEKVTVGRQINEGDILYSFVPEKDFRQFKDHKNLLEGKTKELLKEIAEIMRRKNPVWGV